MTTFCKAVCCVACCAGIAQGLLSLDMDAAQLPVVPAGANGGSWLQFDMDFTLEVMTLPN